MLSPHAIDLAIALAVVCAPGAGLIVGLLLMLIGRPHRSPLVETIGIVIAGASIVIGALFLAFILGC